MSVSSSILPFLAGLSIGTAVGVVFTYLTAVKPLIKELRTMKFSGFKVDHFEPPRPKTVKPLEELIRED